MEQLKNKINSDDLNTAILNFFSEVGQLKNIKRSGWWTIGIKNPESVADHSFRCALICFVLAKLEGAEPYKTAMIGLCNDLHEARIGDQHKVSQKYFDHKNAEKKASEDQLFNLPDHFAKDIRGFMKELWDDHTKEGIVARDADILECMIQGREYYSYGSELAKEFYHSSYKLLKTESAKELASMLDEWDPQEWLKREAVLER